MADFVQHTANLKIPNNHQWFEPRDTWTEETWENERVKTKAMHTPGFWYAIPLMPGAKTLWNAAHSLGKVGILTAKPQDTSPGFIGPEKLQWIRDYMGPMPDENFVCCLRSEKSQYAPDNILVDDDPRNCNSWSEAGGNAILHGSKYVRDGGSVTVVEHADVEKTIKDLETVLHV